MAATYDWTMRGYERHMAERKRSFLADLSGTVVELGAGTGANLQYLPADADWIGIEPSPAMRRRAAATATSLDRNVDIRPTLADQTGLPDDSADIVLTTLVLCSVPDVDTVFAEIRRILRPGGRFICIEHIAAPRRTAMRTIQNICAPCWRIFADGCRCNAPTLEHIERASFSSCEIEHFSAPAGPCSPHIAARIIP